MSNTYSVFAAHDSFKCSQELADKIIASLEQDDELHGIEAEYNDGELYLYGEDGFADPNNLSDTTLALIGEALRALGLPYLGWGASWYSDKCRPASCSGCTGRFYSDGSMETAEAVFTHDLSKS